MDTSSKYYKQVQLLISILPIVAEEECFALKGGTAKDRYPYGPKLGHPRFGELG